LSASRPRPRFDPSINYYQVLDVPVGASKEQITRAYRRLMRLTHPDNFQDPAQRAKAEERAKLLNAAYGVLSRPDIRQQYDAQMRATAVSEAIMQRYTGNVPGRAAPPRRPPPRVIRAQRRAFGSAVRQFLLSVTAFVVVLLVVILAGLLAWQGIAALV
jgi:curved DNA-binding protein CbpA